MKYLYSLTILTFFVFFSSCRKDFKSSPNTGNLTFSKDTVYLDTVFTNIGSSTYTIKVYNKSNDDIVIPTINLEKGAASYYRLNVDGLPGKSFNDIQILAKDSIFIFIETTLDIDNLPNNNQDFLYTDKILFDSGNNQQDVDLVTLVKDAVFLYPQRFEDGTIETIDLGFDQDDDGNNEVIEGFYLEDNELHFTNEKPYVIYGYAGINTGKTLTIDPGARIHFHKNSGILVEEGGSIKCNGLPSQDDELQEGQIVFESDRLEPSFSEVAGQWGAIWLRGGSTNHEFSYTTIKNGTVGIFMEGNDGDLTLSLNNVQVYNQSSIGLYLINSSVLGNNVVVNNAGLSSLLCTVGGIYQFNHSTFVNYWSQGFRTNPSVQLDNFIQTGETTFDAFPLQANFNNCIIYGNDRLELALYQNEDAAFNINFKNSLIRFEDTVGDFDEVANYPNTNPELYLNSVFNEDPAFFDTSLNNFNIETDVSGADGIGDSETAILLPNDITGAPRNTSSPDAGAYESVEFPE